MPGHEPRHICAARARLPLRLIVLALDIVPEDPGHPLELVTALRCGLEAHSAGPHFDLVRELTDARRGEVWARWENGREPDGISILGDCPADNGEPGPSNDGCTLFAEHRGGHSFEFSDPEYDAIRTSPAYEELREEIDNRLG
ncbi:hypothetical protein ACIBCM_14465 [Streptomyces sp. NPDC051018]|uniref:hypothetical protein n=1 Tax=Streptomyces sp. NPDC051018 TaxID=3365639 RepID=UPI00378FA80B